MFQYNEIVEYEGMAYIVVGQSKWQSRHLRPECWMVCWNISPVEFEGMEHDEDIWVGDATLKAYFKKQGTM